MTRAEKRFQIEFGERLRDSRVNWAELTQKQLAEKSGLTAMHISHFECGRRLPCLRNYIALVRALKTNADYMLGLDK